MSWRRETYSLDNCRASILPWCRYPSADPWGLARLMDIKKTGKVFISVYLKASLMHSLRKWLIIIIIIIIIQFLVLFSVTFNPSLSLYLRPSLRDVMIIYILCVHVFCCFFQDNIFQSYWLYTPKEMSSSYKARFFKSTWTTRYLVNAFISLFFDHTQGSHNYMYSGSSMVSHFFHFNFLVFVFCYILWVISYYLLTPTYQLEGIFFFYSP